MTGFVQFNRERQYLHNLAPATLDWYRHRFKWLPSESPSQAELRDTVLRMREKGLKATGCNSAIRAINAYLKWAASAERIAYLKEEQRVLPTFTLPQVALLAMEAKGIVHGFPGLEDFFPQSKKNTFPTNFGCWKPSRRST